MSEKGTRKVSAHLQELDIVTHRARDVVHVEIVGLQGRFAGEEVARPLWVERLAWSR
jgi:hypothetical protein